MPIQLDSVKIITNIKRPIPMFIYPLSISDNEFIKGKLGTNQSTLDAMAICGSLPIPNNSAALAKMEPKHAAISADIKGLKLRSLSHSRSEYPIILAIKVTKHTSISPPAKYAKQAHATPTIGATILAG